jgi:hypothetical protein
MPQLLFSTTKNNPKESQMNRINRREFLSFIGSATAASIAIPAMASTATTDNQAVSLVTSLYVKGLVMVDL